MLMHLCSAKKKRNFSKLFGLLIIHEFCCYIKWKKLSDTVSSNKFQNSILHSGQKCLPRVACLWSKMPLFQGAGMKEGGEPLPLAFQYLILMIWRHCDLNLVIISSLASKCQDFKVEMPVFQLYVMKSKTSKFKKVLAFWSQWRYHDQI